MSRPTHRWGAPYRCLAWVLIASLLAASCATRNVPPIGAGGKPFKPESDEVRLWSQAEKEEEALAKKRSEEHTSELQSLAYLVCRLLLEKKKKENKHTTVQTSTLSNPPTIRASTHA